MELKINGKPMTLEFNFASLKLWEKKLLDGDGNKQSYDDIFDYLFSGLVNKTPETLVEIVYGGLASQKPMPEYGDAFNAVSEIMGNEGLDKLSEQLMAELTAFGFFKVSMKQWRDSMKKMADLMGKGLKELKKPTKNAKPEVIQEYNQQKATLENTKEGLGETLDALDKLVKVTETSL